MFKKSFMAGVLAVACVSAASAVNLDPFGGDFKRLLEGIARDVAPTLRLGALAGDLQADATIDHFDATAFGLGLTLSDGIATILRPGATTWTFVVPMDSFIPNGFDTTFERLMAYPSYKFAFGVAVGGGWDTTLSGNWLPSSLTGAILKPVLGNKTAPELGFANIGLEVRKTLLNDTGAITSGPALSLGAGYHFSSFHLSADVGDYIPVVNLGNDSSPDNQTTTGSIAMDTASHVVTLDLHVSKHLLFFTPYVKLTGAYQNTEVTGDSDLTLTTEHSGTTSFKAHPVVELSDFAFLTTLGFDLDLFVVHYNLNVVADMSRALLNVHSFTLDGIDANAISINTGFHFAF